MPKHTLKYDECINTLANEYGVTPDAIINHPENSELLKNRQILACLAPGDELTIPDAKLKELVVSDTNYLTVEDNTYLLPIRLLDQQVNPVPGIEIRCACVELENHLTSTTNGEGIATFEIPENCRDGLLAYQWEGKIIYRPFKAGTLLPPEQEQGMQQRLCNLHQAPFVLNSNGKNAPNVHAHIEAFAEECDKSEEDFIKILVGSGQ